MHFARETNLATLQIKFENKHISKHSIYASIHNKLPFLFVIVNPLIPVMRKNSTTIPNEVLSYLSVAYTLSLSYMINIPIYHLCTLKLQTYVVTFIYNDIKLNNKM